MLEISDIEQNLSQNGKFSLLDWLLSENLLSYSNYEAWRYTELKTLDEHIELDRKVLLQLIETIKKHGETLKLSTQLQEYFSWQEQNNSALSSSENKDIHQQLTQQWLRSQDQPQLDLFMDNSAAIAENNLLSALAGRQWQQARQYLYTFTEHNPNHNSLGRYLDLVNYGDHMQANEIIDNENFITELKGLQHEVQPLAKETLGDAARDYLAYAWRRIADNLHGVNFSAEQPELHRSYALRQIPDWSAIHQNLCIDEQLYQYPQLLETLSISLSMLKRYESSLLLWCHLFEKFPDYAQNEIEQNTNRPIYTLWQKYWEVDDDWPVDFFPAFILVENPAVVHVLTEFQSLEHTATTQMIALLLRRQKKEDEINERKNLQEISPTLLKHYLTST